MRRSRPILVLVAALAALAAAACSAPKEHKSKDSPGSLNLFMYQKPAGIFGPLAPASGPDQEVISLVYDTLMVSGPQGKLVPMAATSAPTVSADGKTITYKLKSGLTWNDGQPLTSKDLVFTYTRAADTNTTSGWSSYLTNVQGAADMGSGKATSISGFSISE